VAQRPPVLLGNGSIRGVLALDVQQMAALRQVHGRGNSSFASLFHDIPLAETDGSVFVSVS